MPIDDPGSALLYRAATGFERALADTDAERIIAVEAEKIIDVWDPYRIDYRNLPFLAWAMGVNLWSDDWSEAEKRDWVARQWTLKSLRGTPEGIKQFVARMRARVTKMVRPPARTYLLPAITNEERLAYLARFAQLRLYPFVKRVQLPGRCFVSHQPGVRNGRFLGPLLKLFPTNVTPGGPYTKTAILWDRGVETTLTFREMTTVRLGRTFKVEDQVLLPAVPTDKFFLTSTRGFLDTGFLGVLSPINDRLVRVLRDGSLTIDFPHATYRTVMPGGEPMMIYPDHVAVPHHGSAASTFLARKTYLHRKFLPTSIAWRYLYERWYLNDLSRVPDPRKVSVFLGNTRLGIPAYTAEIVVKVDDKANPAHVHRFLRGFLPPKRPTAIDRICTAVRASMALRDKILVDTNVVRSITFGDGVFADGKHVVGQKIDD